MTGQTVCHYKILEKIGSGGMGEVYLAEDTKLHRPVALKFLPRHLTEDKDARQRFEREAQAAAALNHPNIVTIHEIGEHEGQVFIAMEYVEGQTLKELIDVGARRAVPLPLPDIIAIATQIASGLAAAHEKGIVHRDIKPANIFITKNNVVKILDFGLAKLAGGQANLTRTGTTMGTVAYMSPEQALGKKVDQRTDIWSFGVVLYEMLSGQRPFKGDYEQAIIYSILNEKPEPLEKQGAEEPAELGAIIGKCLEKESQARYQQADELLADLRHEKKDQKWIKTEQDGREVAPPKPGKKRLPIIVAGAAAVIIALLFFLLSPFKLRIGPSESIQAKENSLAVMYFENLQDPEDKSRTSQMITALLTTGLSDSPRYMKVVSSQRLFDILKLLGKENLKIIDKTVASEVARRAGVQWMVTGKVLKEEPNIVLVAEISDAATGTIKATQRVNGAPGEDLFAVVDRLSPQVVQALALPEQAQKELGRPVAEMTTRSQDAYHAYIMGLENYYKLFMAAAKKDLEKALEYDPDFAMAYYWLAQINYEGEDYRAAGEYLAQAQKRSLKMTRKEKLYFEALNALIGQKFDQALEKYRKIAVMYPEEKDAYFFLGEIFNDKMLDQAEAIRCLKKAVAIDPNYKRAYNSLAYVYNFAGDFEKSIWALNHYIALAPDEPNAYDTRGDVYAQNGQLDAAIESVKKAVAIKPDFYLAVERLGYLHMFKQEYAEAEKYFKKLVAADNPLTQALGRSDLAFIPMYQGKLRLALKIIDNTIAVDRTDQKFWRELVYLYQCKAKIHEERGELGVAIRELETGFKTNRKVDPGAPVFGSPYYVYLLTRNGQMAEAEALVMEMKKGSEGNVNNLGYCSAAGSIALANNDLKGAQYIFEKGKGYAFYGTNFWARAFLQLGAPDKTVALLEKALSKFSADRIFNAIDSVKAHYVLGMAYEKLGQTAKAFQKYKDFLDVWKDADPGLPEVADARQRLEKLKKL
jgi:tetratricopeptide (TPR) repeat protein/predicted Ser/Thr protein kinase